MKGYVIVMIVENQANVAASSQNPLPRKKTRPTMQMLHLRTYVHLFALNSNKR